MAKYLNFSEAPDNFLRVNPFSVFEREKQLDSSTVDDWLKAEAELLTERHDDSGSDLSGPVEWIESDPPRIWRKDI